MSSIAIGVQRKRPVRFPSQPGHSQGVHGAGTIAHTYAPHAPCIFIQSVVVTRELDNASHVRNDMMYADRQFEFTVDDGGLPGVFLPKVTVVRGYYRHRPTSACCKMAKISMRAAARSFCIGLFVEDL